MTFYEYEITLHKLWMKLKYLRQLQYNRLNDTTLSGNEAPEVFNKFLLEK